MKTEYKISLLTVSLTSLLLLNACGGGGSGSGGSASTPSAPVNVTAANAPQVSGASLDASTGLQGVSSNSTSGLVGAVTQTDSNIDLIEAIVSNIKAVSKVNSSATSASVTGAVFSDTIPCSPGSLDFTLDDADDNQALSNGDTINFNANSCTEGGVTSNGKFGVTNVIVTGDLDSFPYSLSMAVSADNFSATENGETVTMNGNLTISTSSSDGIVLNDSISGDSIQVTETGVVHTLRNFQIDASDNMNTLAYTIDINATVDSPQIGGSATITTDTLFQGIGDENPNTGQATITGANNSSVTLIALDAVNVRLQVDENGDSIVDSTTDTTWDAI